MTARTILAPVTLASENPRVQRRIKDAGFMRPSPGLGAGGFSHLLVSRKRNAKINFARNPHENAALRAGVVKIPKLFYKNVLDVSR